MLITMCAAAMVQKDILCEYFDFISLSPVFGEQIIRAKKLLRLFHSL